MNLAYVNLICWGAFCLVWILGAVYNLALAPTTTTRRARYDWLILAAAMRAAVYFVPQKYLHLVEFHVRWLQVAGAILLVIATLFTLWARFVLGKMWASHAAVRAGHQLITSGPYQITRHPIYTGLLGMILGTAVSRGQGLFLLGFFLVLVFFFIRIRNEERFMMKTFGDQYVEYKKRVPQIVPGWGARKYNTHS